MAARALRLALAVAVGIVLGVLVLTDRAMQRPYPLIPARGAVSIVAADGVRLVAWLSRPQAPNGSAVLVQHGLGDSHSGMGMHAPFLLDVGYTVLAPDLRGHGGSGGDLITFGARESGDARRWVDWLRQQGGVERVYGLGQSLGGAVVLEARAFRAVVADSAFASFTEIAHDRLGRLWFLTPFGAGYAKLRYGVNLTGVSALRAVRESGIPVLVIHGTADSNIPARHSALLHAANPAGTRLWLLPGAEHVEAIVSRPGEYAALVTEWFASHP